MITDILKEKGYSTRKLSIKTGIPYTTLYEYVSGKRDYKKMPLEHFISISEELNISLEALIDKWDDVIKTSVENNYVLNNDTVVLYRLYRQKNGFYMYVKYGNEWIMVKQKYPKTFPDKFESDYYNMIANKTYYKAVKKNKRGDFYGNDTHA